MSKNVNKNINGGAAGKAKAAGRMATVAAATIAMTGGSLLSPLTAVAQGANGADTTAKPAAVLSPLTSAAAASAGAGTASAVQKVANLQAAVDAARAKAAAAKADLDAAALLTTPPLPTSSRLRAPTMRPVAQATLPLLQLRPSWSSRWVPRRTRPMRT